MGNISYEQLLFNAIKNGQQNVRSVYDIWLSLGNTGSSQDFLDSLKGDSAYQIWCEIEGNEGKSVEEFIESLKPSTELSERVDELSRKVAELEAKINN